MVTRGFMFQDEKTTELDLNAKLHNSRWTESVQSAGVQTRKTAALSPKAPELLEPNHIPWLIKLGAAVSILLLSLWLF